MERTNSMKAYAHLKNLSITSRKVRLVVNLIRKMDIEKALNTLSNTQKRSAPVVLKLLKSAISNATNNHKMNLSSLVIEEIFVNEGRKLKRIRPRAKGSAYPIWKRASHITVVLTDEVVESKTKKEIKK